MNGNAVEINEEDIHAELKLLEGAQPGAPPGSNGANGAAPSSAPAATPAAPPMDWTIPAGLVVMVFDRLVAPNWSLDLEEKQMLLEQTSATLAVCFPTVNLDPRIAAVMSLGGAFVMVAQRRFDPDTGKLKPLRIKKAEPVDEENADADRAAA
jgi:hypothetical protein